MVNIGPIYGGYMVNRWWIYCQSMVKLCPIYGEYIHIYIYMVNLCPIYGEYMVNVWSICGQFGWLFDDVVDDCGCVWRSGLHGPATVASTAQISDLQADFKVFFRFSCLSQWSRSNHSYIDHIDMTYGYN